MPAHRLTPEARKLWDPVKRKSHAIIQVQEPLGDIPDWLSPAVAKSWKLIVDNTPTGVQLTKADREMVEIAAYLMTEQRKGEIRGVDRGQLMTILGKLGRSPRDRIILGISQEAEISTDDEFAQFRT
jgi:phage terminase small subunit